MKSSIRVCRREGEGERQEHTQRGRKTIDFISSSPGVKGKEGGSVKELITRGNNFFALSSGRRDERKEVGEKLRMEQTDQEL